MSSDVSRETWERLEHFHRLLLKWSSRINLISPRDFDSVAERHIADCVQYLPRIPLDVEDVTDIGSGGGLPGLVIAIGRPDIHVTLIESDVRKCAFLRSAARELSVRCDVVTARIEEAAPMRSSVVTARALAPLAKLLPYVSRHMAMNGRFLAQKGRRWREEVSAALEIWTFDYEMHQSVTEDGAALLEITNISEKSHAR